MEQVTEGKIIDGTKKAGEKIVKGSAKAGVAVSKGLNRDQTKRAKLVASMVVRKPKDGSSEDVYKTYKKKLAAVTTAYKLGEIAAASAVLLGPADWVLKLALGIGMYHSKEDVDKVVLGNLKDKALQLNDNLKKCKVTQKTYNKIDDTLKIEKRLKMIDAMASDVAKSVDKVNNKIHAKPVAESADLMLSLESFIDTDKEVGIETYEAVIRFIDKADYSNDRDVLIIEKCIELMMNDCNL